MWFSQNNCIPDLEWDAFHGPWGGFCGESLCEFQAARGTLLACRNLGAQIFDRATGGNVEISFGLRGVDDATRRVDEDVFST